MTQEEKDLLLKDLCARLPCGVTVLANYGDTTLTKEMGIGTLHDFMFDNVEIKPYLRPMVTITEDELEELSKIDEVRGLFSSRHLTYQTDGNVIDYINKKMFDWRGLIGKGLALEAPEGMY